MASLAVEGAGVRACERNDGEPKVSSFPRCMNRKTIDIWDF